jgi:Cell wall-associated hydrolases (invasion-associated proteins)
VAPAMPRTVRHRWRALLWCAAVVAATLFLPPPASVYAAPSPGDIENQINAAWEKLEPIIEQYNQIHGQLQQTQAKIDVLQKQMNPLQMQVDLAMTRVGAISAQMYKTGPGSRLLALLNSGGPDTFLEQMTELDQLARQQNAQVSAAASLRDSFAEQKKPLDGLQARLAAQDADLAAKKSTIQAQMSQLQKLRLAAYGSSGQAVGNLRPVACPVEYYGDKGSIAAKKACSLIGKPYIWGAAGPSGYDCSGLTLVAWASVGVTLGHYTKWQWSESRPVSRANARPGDLVFYYSDLHHMAMYVGGGWMVHAPHTGDYVRMAQVDRGMPIAGFRRPG